MFVFHNANRCNTGHFIVLIYSETKTPNYRFNRGNSMFFDSNRGNSYDMINKFSHKIIM